MASENRLADSRVAKNRWANGFRRIRAQFPAFDRAMKLQSAGDLAGARQHYLELIDESGLTAPCLHQLAVLAAVKGDHARAADLFLQVVRMAPDMISAFINLSAAYDHCGQQEAATRVLEDLAIRFYQQKQYALAEPLFRRVLGRSPRSYAANTNLGNCVAWLDKKPEALALSLRALRLYGRARPEMAAFVRDLEADLDPEFLKTVAPLPAGPVTGALTQVEEALTTLSKLLRADGRSEAAEKCNAMALKVAPDYALAHWNHAFDLLTRRDFAAGWAEYQWRWRWPDFPEPHRHLPGKPWQSEDLAGRRVLIWSEQGLGDTMQFIPLIGGLQRRYPAATLMLEVPQALVRLLATSFPDVEVIARSDHPDQLRTDKTLDYTVPLLDLPYLLELRADALPMATNYLKAPPESLEAWNTRLGEKRRPRIGLVWASRPYPDARRSVSLERFKPLIAAGNADWFSLQVGDRSADIAKLDVAGLTDLAPQLTNFAETAAAVAQMDLVITVDTSVAHLAGGLGCPVWTLVLNIADWRWGEDRAASPWYPTMRIFRQQKGEDWAPVLARLQLALNEDGSPLRPSRGDKASF